MSTVVRVVLDEGVSPPLHFSVFPPFFSICFRFLQCSFPIFHFFFFPIFPTQYQRVGGSALKTKGEKERKSMRKILRTWVAAATQTAMLSFVFSHRVSTVDVPI